MCMPGAGVLLLHHDAFNSQFWEASRPHTGAVCRSTSRLQQPRCSHSCLPSLPRMAAAWRFSISSSRMRICASLGALCSCSVAGTLLYVYLRSRGWVNTSHQQPSTSHALSMAASLGRIHEQLLNAHLHLRRIPYALLLVLALRLM